MKEKNRRWIAAGIVMLIEGILGSQDVNQAMVDYYPTQRGLRETRINDIVNNVNASQGGGVLAESRPVA
jgi:hypothetical protein